MAPARVRSPKLGRCRCVEAPDDPLWTVPDGSRQKRTFAGFCHLHAGGIPPGGIDDGHRQPISLRQKRRKSRGPCAGRGEVCLPWQPVDDRSHPRRGCAKVHPARRRPVDHGATPSPMQRPGGPAQVRTRRSTEQRPRRRPTGALLLCKSYSLAEISRQCSAVTSSTPQRPSVLKTSGQRSLPRRFST